MSPTSCDNLIAVGTEEGYIVIWETFPTLRVSLVFKNDLLYYHFILVFINMQKLVFLPEIKNYNLKRFISTRTVWSLFDVVSGFEAGHFALKLSILISS